MFDVFSTGPRQTRAAGPALISIAGHVIVLGLAVIIPLLYATDAMPKVPTMMAFVASMPATSPPPPPPPPPPPSAPRPAEPKSEARTVRPDAFAAPVEAPADIRPEPPGVTAAGAEGGVEGGVVGGVAGGIVGGLVTAPPPPPPPPPPAPEPPKGPVRIGGNVQAPALLKRVEPDYPEIALVTKITGLVILEATVGEDGAVQSVRVLRSVKFLDQAAIDAVKQWRYSPLVLNGIPTPFVLSVTLNFSVRSS